MTEKNTTQPMPINFTRLFALIGTLQGFVLWRLWHADKFHQWPARQPVAFAALLYVAIAAPLAVYWTQGVEGFCGRKIAGAAWA